MGCVTSSHVSECVEAARATGVFDLALDPGITDAQASELQPAISALHPLPVALSTPVWPRPRAPLSGAGLKDLCRPLSDSLRTVSFNEAALPRVSPGAIADILVALGHVEAVSLRGDSCPERVIASIADSHRECSAVELAVDAPIDLRTLALIPRAFPRLVSLQFGPKSHNAQWASLFTSLHHAGVQYRTLKHVLLCFSFDDVDRVAIRLVCPSVTRILAADPVRSQHGHSAAVGDASQRSEWPKSQSGSQPVTKLDSYVPALQMHSVAETTHGLSRAPIDPSRLPRRSSRDRGGTSNPLAGPSTSLEHSMSLRQPSSQLSPTAYGAVRRIGSGIESTGSRRRPGSRLALPETVRVMPGSDGRDAVQRSPLSPKPAGSLPSPTVGDGRRARDPVSSTERWHPVAATAVPPPPVACLGGLRQVRDPALSFESSSFQERPVAREEAADLPVVPAAVARGDGRITGPSSDSLSPRQSQRARDSMAPHGAVAQSRGGGGGDHTHIADWIDHCAAAAPNAVSVSPEAEGALLPATALYHWRGSGRWESGESPAL